MIIWLNGAYGSGKTTIAELLHERIFPRGFMIQRKSEIFLEKICQKKFKKMISKNIKNGGLGMFIFLKS